jgi:hypothetical protein
MPTSYNARDEGAGRTAGLVGWAKRHRERLPRTQDKALLISLNHTWIFPRQLQELATAHLCLYKQNEYPLLHFALVYS